MFLIIVSSHPSRGHFITPVPVNAGLESHPNLLTHIKADNSPPLMELRSQPQPADRRQQSAPHQSTWRRAVPWAPSSPSHHPPARHRLGRAPVLALSHASRTAGAGQRAPTFFPFPPLLQSLASSFHPFLDVARAPRGSRGLGSMHLHSQGLPLAGRPFQASARPPIARGGRAPAGRGRTPALPGEVCKHSCSRAREPLEVRPQGLHRAGARAGRKGPAGGGGSQAHNSGEIPDNPGSGRPRALHPAPSAPPHAPKSPGEQREAGSPHPPGRTHPPSRQLTGNGRVPIWTAFGGQNCTEPPSPAHQV